MRYLHDGETTESRLDDLLADVRHAPQEDVRQRRALEAQTLAMVMMATAPMGTVTNIVNGIDGNEDLSQATLDLVTGALDAAYGGEAPAAVRANFLYHLTGQGEPAELTGPEFALEPQANDPDDDLAWTAIQAERRGLTPEEAHQLAEREREGLDLPTAPAGSTGPIDREGFDLDDQDDPEPISAADRLRARTTKPKGKKK